MLMKKLLAGAATTALVLGVLSVAQAQEINGGISGTLTDEAGRPVANAQVTIVYGPTHQTTTTTTSSQGFFTARDLTVGGPYQVTASDASHSPKTVEVGAIGIGAPYELNLSFGGAPVQEVTVTGARIRGTTLTQTGPRSTYTAADIQTLPTFARDLKDVARTNPFVTIDPTNSNALIIAGSNPRLSTIYVDGVKQSDDFGLNGNGYPTQRSPLSIDAVKAFNVEIAPYDVQYGEFQGGVLNIVTKNGSNELHGGAFYEYDSNRMAGGILGNQAVNQPLCTNGAASGTNVAPSAMFSTTNGTVTCGDRFLNPHFSDKNYGGYVSGAIVPDKLFFFFDYEKFEGLAPTSYVASDASGANPVPGVTTADVTNVANILNNTYGYNPGVVGGGGSITDEKYFARFDWNVTDKQHLFFTYQNTEGSSLNFPNGSTSSTTGILPYSTNYYNYEQNLEAFTVDLTSHWTDKLASEFEYTHKTVDSITALTGDPTFGEFKIKLATGASLYAGPDISRQANQLGTTDDQYKLKVNYTIGQHTLTAGYEHEETEAFDLFVQNANGTYSFDNTCGPGLNQPNGVLINLQAKVACQLVYANAFDNNAATAGATETTSIDTGYIQDEWRILPNLSVKAGVRYEHYSVDTDPRLNQRFVNEYGFPNNLTLDGDDIIMPRFGFNWRPDPTLTISGGLGLFSGGNPTVYFYDSFTNPGNLLGNVTCTPTTASCSAALQNVVGNKVGASALAANTASANLGTGISNSVDPKFNVPSTWKASLSLQKSINFSDYSWMGTVGSILGDDWRFSVDDVYETVKDAVVWKDLFELAHPGGTAPDGRPEFDRTRFTVPNTAQYDIELTNTHKGGGNVVAVGVGKSWHTGWDAQLSYTHEDIKEVNPATSSVAASNYRQNAFSDPNNQPLAPSDYNVDHEVKLTLSYQHNWFGDNRTSVRVFGDYRSGLPYSYTFQQAFVAANGSVTTTSTGLYDQVYGQFATSASSGNELLYVPKADSTGQVTATSDPVVKYAANFNVAAFNTFLQQTGLIKYAGSISPRNAFTSSDVTRFDVEFTQEFPAFFPNAAKGEVYFDLFNIGNFFDKNWGVIKQTGFPYFQSPVQAVNCQAVAQVAGKAPLCAAGVGNFYEYRPGSATTQTLGSTSGGSYYPGYQVKVGVRYKF